jgi:hypothetical protein
MLLVFDCHHSSGLCCPLFSTTKETTTSLTCQAVVSQSCCQEQTRWLWVCRTAAKNRGTMQENNRNVIIDVLHQYQYCIIVVVFAVAANTATSKIAPAPPKHHHHHHHDGRRLSHRSKSRFSGATEHLE